MKRFLAISLLLHALLFSLRPASWPQQQPAVLTQTLALQLVVPGERVAPEDRPPDKQPPTTRNPPPPASRNPQAPAIRHAAVPEHGQTISHEARQERPQLNNARVADYQNSDNAAALNSVRAALHSALLANFSYPRRARMRGWEGTVVIALRILPDGAVTDARVSNSSGIRVLDEAALRSIRAVHIPQAIAWIDGRILDISIPVEYRLTDS